jgi:hypothetical protein
VKYVSLERKTAVGAASELATTHDQVISHSGELFGRPRDLREALAYVLQRLELAVPTAINSRSGASVSRAFV